MIWVTVLPIIIWVTSLSTSPQIYNYLNFDILSHAYEGVRASNHQLAGKKFNLLIIVSLGVLIPKAHLLVNRLDSE